jgi:hypothetical protein
VMFEIAIFCRNSSGGGLLGRALAVGTSRGRAAAVPAGTAGIAVEHDQAGS